MTSNDLSQRLSQIATQWSMLYEAHRDDAPDAEARGKLMQRYLGAVYRYLLGATRDEDVAQELFQEFAVRFLRGDLGNTRRERGRFRDYVRKVLINLVNDHHRQRQRVAKNMAPDAEQQIADLAQQEDAGDTTEFVDRWREEILHQTWEALRSSQQNYYDVLRLQAEAPDLPSSEMAEQLSAQQGRTFTAANVRKTLQRARERFASLLLEEVALGMDHPTADELERELVQLNLLAYCRSALSAHQSKEVQH